ncbi:MAG: DUF2779 domain-containing protein [Candidatus Thermoplasmatota archaeon]|nr:DUF2779 domain-containing protein [Candidatus Thermoplasmatota archaeon]
MAKTRALSKSRYVEGIKCHKLFYVSMKDPDAIPDFDVGAQFTVDQGTEAGELARDMYPGGTLIPAYPLVRAVAETKEALARGDKNIYEAALEHDDVHVKVDILELVGEGWYDMIEVKASTQMKDYYIPDMAVQRYVLEGAGLKVRSSKLMHLNKEYRHPGQNPLFVLEECTEQVLEEMAAVPENLRRMKDVLLQDQTPNILIGPQCSKPHSCPLLDECWAGVPSPSIFDIPRFMSRQSEEKFSLYHRGTTIDAIPSGISITAPMQRFIDSVLQNKPIIDGDVIKGLLSDLEEPIHFMDFETIGWAIPRYKGTKPYQAIPFQWSLHTMDGGLRHKEYLHDGVGDPRDGFLSTLLEALGTEGRIVVYFESFEASRLKELMEHAPEKKNEIEQVIGRIWDLHPIFKNHYTHPDAMGSASIKKVLPALCPECSYKGLDIQDGMAASASYAQMLKTVGEEREQMRLALLEYCKLDTLAMVKLYEKLRELEN